MYGLLFSTVLLPFLTKRNDFTYYRIIFHEEYESDQKQATKGAKSLGKFQSIEDKLNLKLQNTIFFTNWNEHLDIQVKFRVCLNINPFPLKLLRCSSLENTSLNKAHQSKVHKTFKRGAERSFWTSYVCLSSMSNGYCPISSGYWIKSRIKKENVLIPQQICINKNVTKRAT